MKAFLSHTASAVRVNGEPTDWFSVDSGTGQDDIQGPPVFNFCLSFSAYLMEQNKVVSKAARLHHASSGLEESLLDNSKEGLQETSDLVCQYYSTVPMRIEDQCR